MRLLPYQIDRVTTAREEGEALVTCEAAITLDFLWMIAEDAAVPMKQWVT